jgi:hypothetical protein
LCGAIRYRISGALGALVFCHCAQCRKAQGVGFAANIPVPLAEFQLECGDELLAGFRSSATKTRYFCSRCSSPLYSHVDAASAVRIRAGTLDEGAPAKALGNIFVASKAPWIDIPDALPQHDRLEPERS